MHPLSLVGIWNGNINAGNFTLMIAMEFVRVSINNKDEVRAFMDIPDFYVQRFFITDMQFDGDNINFHLPSLEGSYKGKFDATNIKGIWTDDDGDNSFQVDLKKVKDRTLYNAPKPQTPKANVPYAVEEVSFKVSDGVIYGTLTYPKNKDITLGVVISQGPDGTDRDNTYFEHKPFAVIADHLTRHGIAVLRYDEQGYGKSTGEKSTGWGSCVENTMEAVEYLDERKDLDIEYVGVLGHALGSISALLTANYSDDVDFVVGLAPIGVSFKELFSLQEKSLSKVLKRPEKYEEFAVALYGILYDYAKEEKDPKKLKDTVEKDFDKYIVRAYNEKNQDALIALTALKRNFLQFQFADWFTQEWLHSAWEYDPAELLKHIDVPVFGLWASNDVTVSAKENSEAFKKGLVKAHEDNEYVILDGLNHFFQPSRTGNPFDYPIIRETISPKALTAISNWILEVDDEDDDDDDDDDDNDRKLSLKKLLTA